MGDSRTFSLDGKIVLGNCSMVETNVGLPSLRQRIAVQTSYCDPYSHYAGTKIRNPPSQQLHAEIAENILQYLSSSGAHYGDSHAGGSTILGNRQGRGLQILPTFSFDGQRG